MCRKYCKWLLLAIFACCTHAFAQNQYKDDRSQLPAFFRNSYVGLTVGYPDFGFTNVNLENNFIATRIQNPYVGLRLYLGHYFNPYIALQLSLMRPIRWVHYSGILPNISNSVWMSLFGITARPTWPITDRISLHGEAGLGIISRHGFDINKVTAVSHATIATLLTGAGLTVAITPNWHLGTELIYTLANHSQKQPPIFYGGLTFYYLITPTSSNNSTDNSTHYYFPLNFIQLGFFTNAFFYWEVDRYFAPPYIPVFFEADVKTRNGIYLMYERNLYHTRKTFSLDWGVSVSRWQTTNLGNVFYAFSIFPALRIWIIRSNYVDFYFTYSIAGPTLLTRKNLEGMDTGELFTFQDFMGIGLFLGKSKRFNVNVKITHYSNGNLFPLNPGVEVPLTLAFGFTF